MIEVTGGRTQAIADVTHRLTLRKLAEQHRYQVGPTIVSLLMLVGLFVIDQFPECITVNLRDDLGE